MQNAPAAAERNINSAAEKIYLNRKFKMKGSDRVLVVEEIKNELGDINAQINEMGCSL